MSDKPTTEADPVHIHGSQHGEVRVTTTGGEVLDSSELQATLAAAAQKALGIDDDA
jgi:CTP synthase (UTP-ammonia lyase)